MTINQEFYKFDSPYPYGHDVGEKRIRDSHVPAAQCRQSAEYQITEIGCLCYYLTFSLLLTKARTRFAASNAFLEKSSSALSAHSLATSFIQDFSFLGDINEEPIPQFLAFFDDLP